MINPEIDTFYVYIKLYLTNLYTEITIHANFNFQQNHNFYFKKEGGIGHKNFETMISK